MLSAKKELFTPSGGGYQISRSVRLRSSASGYFGRTPASAGSRTTWTWSAWVKRGELTRSTTGGVIGIFGGGNLGAGVASFQVYFNSAFDIYIQDGVMNVANYLIYQTTSLYRDPSAWYHIIIAMDTTQATAANRTKVYVNGVQAPGAFSVTPAQNQLLSLNNNVPQYIGGAPVNPQAYGNVLSYFDGYLAEINFIDGQQLTPSSFGETNAITGVWQPKRYAGTYGTNGYYLNFSDNSAVTTSSNVGIGKDFSGNGNYWTSNSVSVTAGTTYDSMLDVPTLYDDGDKGRGNYCTLNPLYKGTNVTPTEGNLKFGMTAGNFHEGITGTIFPTSGKWYAEFRWNTVTAATTATAVCRNNAAMNNTTCAFQNTVDTNSPTYRSYVVNGNKDTNTTSAAYGSTYTANDTIGVALDLDNGKVWFSKNGAWQASGDPAAGTNAAFTDITGSDGWTFGVSGYGSGGDNCHANFGQRPFTYTPPTGFKALNTQNLPDATIKKGNLFFNTATWSSDIVNPTIGQKSIALGFQPDLVWSKNRDNAESHYWMDSVRGDNAGNKWLRSNATAAEGADALGSTTASYVFNSTGFDIVDTNSASGEVYFNNGSASTPRTYVGWAWNAGGTSTNITVGQYGTSPNIPSIASTVRANPTAGFSVVTWTSTGANATIGHGLGVAPKMVIVKGRSAVSQWFTWHTGLTSGAYALILNLTDAQTSYPTVFNSTTPTSSVFSVGTSLTASTTAVAYCFAEVAGYSAFGKYTGNGSADGPFVYLGFRPRWIMFKRTDVAEGWQILDTARNTVNVVNSFLEANQSNAEGTSTARDTDYTANGFKVRNTSAAMNASGGTYIYAVFAENPFKLSLAR